MTRTIAALAAIALAGCSTTNPPPEVSANPITTVTNIVNQAVGTAAQSQIVTDLQDAKFNLDSAITLGVLPATDPVDGCLTMAMANANITATGAPGASAAPSFQPKVAMPIGFSAASYLYILAAQAKGLAINPGSLVPGACEQIVGHLVLTTLNAPVTSQVNAITAILPGGSK